MKKINHFQILFTLLFLILTFGCNGFAWREGLEELSDDISTTYIFYGTEDEESSSVSFSYEIGKTYSVPEFSTELCKQLGHEGYIAKGWIFYDKNGVGLPSNLVLNDSNYVTQFTVSYDSYSFYAADWDEKNVNYTVNHYQQNITDDEYSLFEVQGLTGKTGTQTQAEAKNYEGFTVQTFEQKTIAGDGSTVVNIYYDRVVTTIKYYFGIINNKTEITMQGKYGSEVSKIENPEDEKNDNETILYKFTKWDPEVPSTFPSADLKIYSIYTTYYKVIFDLDGGITSTTLTSDNGLYVESGTEFNIETPAKSGYAFAYWKDSSDNEVTDKVVTGSMTLTAVWSAAINTEYTVNHYQQNITDDEYSLFEVQGLTGKTGTQTQAEAKNYEGFTVQTFEQKTIAGDGSTVVNIYYDRNEITLTFDVNGGSEISAISGRYGAIVSSQTTTKTGYTFSNWNPELPTTFPIEDSFHTAVWSANTYTISFDSNGGSGTMRDISVSYDEEVPLTANVFTKTGYTFLGWGTDPDSIEKEYSDGAVISNLTSENGNTVTLYAVWSANTYTISFDSNGGSGTMRDISVSYDEEVPLTANAFTKTGYTFLGWGTDPDSIEKEYSDGAVISNLTSKNGNTVTLYAVWSANTYTISFDSNGGSGTMRDISVSYDEEVPLTANAFTKTGYTFLGWGTDPDSIEKEYSDGAVISNLTSKNGNTVILYAVWSKNYVGAIFATEPVSTSVNNLIYKETTTSSIKLIGKSGYNSYIWFINGTEVSEDESFVMNLSDYDAGVYSVMLIVDITYSATVQVTVIK